MIVEYACTHVVDKLINLILKKNHIFCICHLPGLLTLYEYFILAWSKVPKYVLQTFVEWLKIRLSTTHIHFFSFVLSLFFFISQSNIWVCNACHWLYDLDIVYYMWMKSMYILCEYVVIQPLKIPKGFLISSFSWATWFEENEPRKKMLQHLIVFIPFIGEIVPLAFLFCYIFARVLLFTYKWFHVLMLFHGESH